MKDLSNGRVQIDSSDLDRWCNCFNFPYEKCGDCRASLGDLTHLKEGETFTLHE